MGWLDRVLDRTYRTLFDGGRLYQTSLYSCVHTPQDGSWGICSPNIPGISTTPPNTSSPPRLDPTTTDITPNSADTAPFGPNNRSSGGTDPSGTGSAGISSTGTGTTGTGPGGGGGTSRSSVFPARPAVGAADDAEDLRAYGVADGSMLGPLGGALPRVTVGGQVGCGILS